jgi:hypothetical protein
LGALIRIVNLLSIANAGTTDHMARSKVTPDRVRLVRKRAIALSRRQRTDSEDTGEEPEAKPSESSAQSPPADDGARGKPPADAKTRAQTSPPEPSKSSEADTQPLPMRSRPEADTHRDLPVIVPPEPGAEPWPDATPQPMRPVDRAAVRAHTETAGMPSGEFGRPPDMPRTTAPPPVRFGLVEDPTHMPGPREIPGGAPDDPAAPPGTVPPGDSRSLRRDNEFALVYRRDTFVISRFGRVGTRGQWRVVEYPTSAAASHSYAKECSRFVSEGFSDYRG